MTTSVLETLLRNRATGKKAFAVLIDPDKTDARQTAALMEQAALHPVDFFFVGGSLIVGSGMNAVIRAI